ncbi:hypothetical protein V2G26_002904 [Clonostachys chloroleuca]
MVLQEHLVVRPVTANVLLNYNSESLCLISYPCFICLSFSSSFRMRGCVFIEADCSGVRSVAAIIGDACYHFTPSPAPGVAGSYIRLTNLSCTSMLSRTNEALDKPQQGRDKEHKGGEEGNFAESQLDDNDDGSDDNNQ